MACRLLIRGSQSRSRGRHDVPLLRKTELRDIINLTMSTVSLNDHRGCNIGAPEVEAALDLHPDVAECAVVGQPDAMRGMIVHASVVLRGGAAGDAATIKELQDFVKQTIAPYKYPRSLDFIADLPRSATGRLRRSVLREERVRPSR